MPKVQKKGGRGGRSTAASSSQPRQLPAPRRSSRRSQLPDQEPEPPTSDIGTPTEDSDISSLQLGHFLRLVREEVQEEIQSQQARLLGSSNAVVSQSPPVTSSQGSSRGYIAVWLMSCACSQDQWQFKLQCGPPLLVSRWFSLS